MKHDHYGLEYKSNSKNKSKMMRLKREKRIACLVGAIIEGEHMVLPHLCETFYSIGVEHDDIRLCGTAILEEFEKMTINTTKSVEVKVENVRAIMRPCHLELHQ